VDRLIFFSDAVAAIAITLLAIDLPVPTGDTISEFSSSVRHNAGHYLAFLIGFLAISAAWSHHHDIFRYATRFVAGAPGVSDPARQATTRKICRARMSSQSRCESSLP
jgi:uncharacterized membrane protein